MSKTVMVIVAHPDDETLGCGGTIAKHALNDDDVYVLSLTSGVGSRRDRHPLDVAKEEKDRIAAFSKAGDVLGVKNLNVLDYEDQEMDRVPFINIVRSIENYVRKIEPEIVFTHHAGDLNKDHRIVHQAVLTACRPLPGSTVKEIYGFEVLSSTEWGENFTPTHYVDLTEDDLMIKKNNALACYAEEMRPAPHPRNYHASDCQAALRGYHVGVHHAEAFTTIRTIA